MRVKQVVDEELTPEEKIKNRNQAYERKKDFELKHNLRNVENKIGGYWKYDHKITSIFGMLFLSLAVIFKSSFYMALYVTGLLFVIKDTVKSGFDNNGNLHITRLKINPLIYYFLGAGIIVLAAFTSNHFIPGVEGGVTYYILGALP